MLYCDINTRFWKETRQFLWFNREIVNNCVSLTRGQLCWLSCYQLNREAGVIWEEELSTEKMSPWDYPVSTWGRGSWLMIDEWGHTDGSTGMCRWPGLYNKSNLSEPWGEHVSGTPPGPCSNVCFRFFFEFCHNNFSEWTKLCMINNIPSLKNLLLVSILLQKIESMLWQSASQCVLLNCKRVSAETVNLSLSMVWNRSPRLTHPLLHVYRSWH